jgi:hypothetical protein
MFNVTFRSSLPRSNTNSPRFFDRSPSVQAEAPFHPGLLACGGQAAFGQETSMTIAECWGNAGLLEGITVAAVVIVDPNGRLGGWRVLTFEVPDYRGMVSCEANFMVPSYPCGVRV